MKKILIIGVGYVGITVASVFSEVHHVTIYDKNEERIGKIKNGSFTYDEPNLRLNSDIVILSGLENVRINLFDFIFICVGTPIIGGTGFVQEIKTYDLSSLEECVTSLIEKCPENAVLNLVIKSTVLPGTAKKLKAMNQAQIKSKSLTVRFISNPEFLREGFAVEDFKNPERVVIGLDDSCLSNDEIRMRIKGLYEKCHTKPILFVSNETAELSKVASNAMLATHLSFMNELKLLSSSVGSEINDVVNIMGLDPRIGNYIKPGVGYGGYCLPKDVLALRAAYKENNIKSSVIDGVHQTNIETMDTIKNAILQAMNEIAGARLCVYGLAFKSGVMDLRESPIMYIIQNLKSETRNEITLIDEDDVVRNITDFNVTIRATECEVALIGTLSGLERFKITKGLRVVFDPNRLISAEMIDYLRSSGVVYRFF